VGEQADFVVLDADPLESDAAALQRIRVLETWIGGHRVYGGAKRGERPADGPGR
jgi:predicted amidohydrolase YtcJ